MKLVKYRIVRDGFLGYECQKWRLWFPFWLEMGWSNTFESLEKAKEYINKQKDDYVVWKS